MANKEKLFPLSTTGGRIQAQRHKKNLSRIELYDYLFGACMVDDDSKRKVVSGWESNKRLPQTDDLVRLAKFFGTSTDYLLCLNECTNKTNQFISDVTGLSESAIETLAEDNGNENKNLCAIVSYALENKMLAGELMSAILDFFTYHPDIRETYYYIDDELTYPDNMPPSPYEYHNTKRSLRYSLEHSAAEYITNLVINERIFNKLALQADREQIKQAIIHLDSQIEGYDEQDTDKDLISWQKELVDEIVLCEERLKEMQEKRPNYYRLYKQAPVE